MSTVESLQEAIKECSMDSYMFLEGKMQNLRLAILRAAGESARSEGKEISRSHIQQAINTIKNDRQHLNRLLAPNETAEENS